MLEWKFDQPQNSAAITTKQVLEDGFPILSVIHYIDDHSWGFFCGTTDDEKDGRVLGMQEVINIDNTLLDVADLCPGWKASRVSIDSHWVRKKN
ncbi:MAG: hypothetical protein OCD02_11165 [Spirochaetaceae bacterium]